VWLGLILHREFQPWVCRECRHKHRSAGRRGAQRLGI
jgi:hypothetical protein